METLLPKILTIIMGVIWLVREGVFYFQKKEAFRQGYDKAINGINSIAIENLKSAKTIREANEKLSDDQLDDQLASGVFKERDNN